MAENKTLTNRLFNSSEEAVSMVLGLVIVLVVVGLIFNFFQRRKGSVSVPGVSTTETAKSALEVVGESKTTEKEIPKGGEYVVKKGDSLWKIATLELKSGYRWTEIAKLNQLKSPGLLATGQKLKMPELTQTQVKAEEKKPVESVGGTYTVAKGDSLWKIGISKYNDGYSWVKIWKANKKIVRNPDKLLVGAKLVLP